jgi:hypothetical protein
MPELTPTPPAAQKITVRRATVVFEGYRANAIRFDAYSHIDMFFANHEAYKASDPPMTPFKWMRYNAVQLHVHADGRKWLQPAVLREKFTYYTRKKEKIELFIEHSLGGADQDKLFDEVRRFYSENKMYLNSGVFNSRTLAAHLNAAGVVCTAG